MATQEQMDTAATRRREVLNRIRDDLATKGYPPSVGELADATGVTKRTIRVDLERLRRDGRIEVDPGVARGIRLRSR